MEQVSQNMGMEECLDVKISIVVPVYNGAEYLRESIESLLNQTLQEIEIICVDDCSTDHSVAILEELREKDGRLQILQNKKNSWACQSRKTGVLAAKGKYIMLMDQDDSYTPDACEKAYLAIEKQQVDVLQYGTEIINCANIPERRIATNEKLLAPYCGGRLENNLLKECFLDKKFFIQIWNKIYRSEVCKTAFAEIEEGIFPYGEDLYACFLVLYYAKSYVGIEDKLYRYNFGRGMVGSSEISLKTFERFCSSHLAVQALKRFIKKEIAVFQIAEKDRETYAAVLESVEAGLLNECCIKWRDFLEAEQRGVGFEILVNAWGLSETVSWFADKTWYKKTDIACGVQEAECLKYHPRPIRTIAVYYRNIYNGGAQRVVAQLSNMLAAQKNGEKYKYKIILVTDEICEQEYVLDAKIQRVVVPNRERFPKESYRVRAEFWNDFLNEYSVDVVLNSMWEDQTLFWDMLCIKGHSSRPAVVVHCHSFAGILYKLQGDITNETRYSYALADYLITLSDCDTRYWKHINPNVKCIGNPIDVNGIQAEVQKSAGTNILWIGRFSKEKQPMEMISVMSHVVKEMPEVICYFVGDGSEELKEQMRREIECRNLQKYIVFCGYQTDVAKLYQQANVMVSTSQFEGFGLTWYESAAFGVPIVAYEIPWLRANQQLKGLVNVPQRYSRRCAAEIIRLLSDNVYYKKMSALQRESFVAYQQEDISREWNEVLTELENSPAQGEKTDQEEGMLLSQISMFSGMVKEELKEQNNSLRKQRDKEKKKKEEAEKKLQKKSKEFQQEKVKLKEENKRIREKLKHYMDRLDEEKERVGRLKQRLDDVYSSTSYKIGSKATWIPRKLKEGFSKDEYK